MEAEPSRSHSISWGKFNILEFMILLFLGVTFNWCVCLILNQCAYWKLWVVQNCISPSPSWRYFKASIAIHRIGWMKKKLPNWYKQRNTRLMSNYAGEKHLYLMLLICGVSFVMSKYKSKSDLWLSNVQLNESCFEVNNSFSNNTQDPFPTMSSQGYIDKKLFASIFSNLYGAHVTGLIIVLSCHSMT